jgi:two-component system sensor histidine kinase HydH
MGKAAATTLQTRADILFEQQREQVFHRAGRIFTALMLLQWIAGIGLALAYSPYGWVGKVRSTHVHVYASVFLGGTLSALPLLLCLTRPTWGVTRHVVAVAQMLWSALLIHLTGGRIETHFHVFVSLAFLAFLYRDWRVIMPATLVVVADHFIRGLLWPESVYGIANPEWWRFLEHAFWVAFEDVVLVIACIESIAEMRANAQRRAEVEALAAAVGHELRNPLAAVRNAGSYVKKRLSSATSLGEGSDARVMQFLNMIDQEVTACDKIITNLLDYSRVRPLARTPLPLRELVQEAISLVGNATISIVNEVPADLPLPELDKDQFRQVLVNLVQNAVEATDPAREPPGKVVVSAEGGAGRPWLIRVSDEGQGMPSEVLDKIFEPLFTTKTKGTGLGLAIVTRLVKAHGGSIQVESKPGQGTSFMIELP